MGMQRKMNGDGEVQQEKLSTGGSCCPGYDEYHIITLSHTCFDSSREPLLHVIPLSMK